MSFILSTVLMLFCGQLMAQDYIIDKDSVKHFGELKRRLPRVIKIHLTVEKSNKWFDATEIIGYYDSSNGLYHTAAKVQNEDYAVFYHFQSWIVILKILLNIAMGVIIGYLMVR